MIDMLNQYCESNSKCKHDCHACPAYHQFEDLETQYLERYDSKDRH